MSELCRDLNEPAAISVARKISDDISIHFARLRTVSYFFLRFSPSKVKTIPVRLFMLSSGKMQFLL
jgi:hypothetical protein